MQGLDTSGEQREQRERRRARWPSLPHTCWPSWPSCKLKARTILQRCNIFARDLQRAAGGTCLRCPLRKRDAWHVMPRLGTSLRARFAQFRRKANHSRGLCLSAGATRRRRSELGGGRAHACAAGCLSNLSKEKSRSWIRSDTATRASTMWRARARGRPELRQGRLRPELSAR